MRSEQACSAAGALTLAKGLLAPAGRLLNSPSCAITGCQPLEEQAKLVALQRCWQLGSSQHQYPPSM